MPGNVDYLALGERVRDRRRALKLTQEKLAERAGISTSFVGHLERAEKIPSLDTIAALCAALDADMDALVLGRRPLRCDGSRCAMFDEIRKILDAYHG